MEKRYRRTKIVATLGPSTDDNYILEKMIQLGVNVFRLNFSHGTIKEHKERIQKIKILREKLGVHIGLLGDLQGPKIRITKFENSSIFLKKNDIFILDINHDPDNGNINVVGVDYQKLPQDVKNHDIILLDDGRIQLKVNEVTKELKIITEVLIGGWLSNNKGINKLGGGLSAKAITEKDKQDIKLASNMDLDYLAISFPRSHKDIDYAKKLIKESNSNAKIIAKIERAEAVYNDVIMEKIILSSDGIMVARGDLGVEIGDPELVGMQKKLIRKARQLNRIVITATQMMESMNFNPFPTRAEVMDVANAVLDGTDAVMLSSETATGKFPLETVSSMKKVCIGAEKMPSINVSRHRLDIIFNTIEEAVAMSAMYTANHLKGIKAIITMTESGRTALLTSRITSGLPIFALSKNYKTLNLSSLYRGVTPIYFNTKLSGLQAAQEAVKTLLLKHFLSKGDLVIITQGDIMGTQGKTNSSRILQIK
ncbi:Pyruvate kinase II [Buchnera aphidicola (Thelaxes suberi)]|uniref:pyruvate kinase n=1 Tax=Buchnera aphidicola TaxID=9 RepID=UPI003464D283